MWNTGTWECERSMLGGGQSYAVNALLWCEGRLTSVDDGSFMRDFDIGDGECMRAMRAHDLGIRCITQVWWIYFTRASILLIECL